MPPIFLALYRALMWAGHLVCHQMPERSPHLFGAQLPLCWRCMGIAVGAVALLAWLPARRRLPAPRLCLALSLAMPLDVLHALITGGDGDNARRLATGALWGFFSAGLALHLFARAHRRLASSGARPGETDDARADSKLSGARRPRAPAGAAFDGTP